MGPRFHHLTLLCKDLAGYQNLCQMVSRAYTEAPPPQKGAPAGPRALADRELALVAGLPVVALGASRKGPLERVLDVPGVSHRL
jgi:DNA polymerase III alpha subunit